MTWHDMTWHNITQHNTTQHNRTGQDRTGHDTALHRTAPHRTAPHNTTPPDVDNNRIITFLMSFIKSIRLTGDDLALIQSSLLLPCKYTYQLEQPLLHNKSSKVYQNKVTSSLAAIQRPGHWSDNCEVVVRFSVAAAPVLKSGGGGLNFWSDH